jgi:RNA polymerase sigma-70 factor (ECF subfamily)
MPEESVSTDIVRELLRHRVELFGFVRAVVRNPSDAEDVFQNVAAAIIEESRTPREIRDCRAWFKEIARRRVLEHYRMTQRHNAAHLPIEELTEITADIFLEAAPTPSILSDERDALTECLKSIGAHPAEMILLRFKSGKPYSEIATLVKRTEAAVRRAVARSRLALTACMERRLGAKMRNCNDPR